MHGLTLLVCSAVVAPLSAYAEGCASISGTIYRIEADSKHPFQNATITVVSAEANALLATETSDANGRFRIDRLPPIQVRVSAHHMGYIAVSADNNNSGPVVLDCMAGGAHTTVGFELSRGASLNGRVVDEYGEAVESVEVSAAQESPVGLPQSPLAKDRTDDRGVFRIAGLPSGVYQLTPVPPDSRLGFEGEPASVKLLAGEEKTGIKLQLRRLARFSIAGHVVGVEGQVRTLTLERLPRPGPRFSVKTNSMGYFDLRLIPEGRYMATIRGAKTPEDGPGRKHLGVIEVKSDNRDLTLGAVPLGSIQARIEVPPGRDMATLRFKLVSEEGFGTRLVSAVPPRYTFSLSAVTPGRYRIEPVSTAFYVSEIHTSAATQQVEAEDVTIASGASVSLRIVVADSFAHLSGSLHDPVRRAPAHGGHVVIRNRRHRKAVVTGANGSFDLGPIIPGEYEICAWAEVSSGSLFDEDVWRASGCSGNRFTFEPDADIELTLTAKVIRKEVQ